jgi:hypothetical protein
MTQFRVGLVDDGTTGSTISAPALRRSAIAASNTASTCLKSSLSGSEPYPMISRRMPMRAPLSAAGSSLVA